MFLPLSLRFFALILPEMASDHHLLPGRRRDTDEEPVAYHALPSEAATWQNFCNHHDDGSIISPVMLTVIQIQNDHIVVIVVI